MIIIIFLCNIIHIIEDILLLFIINLFIKKDNVGFKVKLRYLPPRKKAVSAIDDGSKGEQLIESPREMVL